MRAGVDFSAKVCYTAGNSYESAGDGMRTVDVHDGLPDTFLRNWSVKRPLLWLGLSACAATAIGLWLPAPWAWLLAGGLALCLLIPPLRRPKTH